MELMLGEGSFHVLRETKLAKWAIALLGVVLFSNLLLYQPVVQRFLSIELESGVVIGSLLDLMIISPALAYAALKLSKKQAVGLMVFGLVLARFIIPEELFAPFTILLYSGIGVEVLFLAAELGLIFLPVQQIPEIRSAMRSSEVGPIFSFLPAVEKKVARHILIRILSSEVLMVYYALFSWRRKPLVHDGASITKVLSVECSGNFTIGYIKLISELCRLMKKAGASIEEALYKSTMSFAISVFFSSLAGFKMADSKDSNR
ncbi:MAG: hypothetical protein ACQEWI_20005 [Bacillota bacterium]